MATYFANVTLFDGQTVRRRQGVDQVTAVLLQLLREELAAP